MNKMFVDTVSNSHFLIESTQGLPIVYRGTSVSLRRFTYILNNSFDPEKMATNGFDYGGTCVPEPKPTGSGNGGTCAAAMGEPTTQCCGIFPNRYPFNDKGVRPN